MFSKNNQSQLYKSLTKLIAALKNPNNMIL